MAITKTILKLTHIEAVVKIVNDAASTASVTIDLDVDLLKSNEVLSGETVTVNLGTVDVGLANSAEATITRNSVLISNMFENTVGYMMEFGADPTENTSDIVVQLTGKGTMFVCMLKLKGFKPKFRPEQGVEA